MGYQKNFLQREGKTKKVWKTDTPGVVILENKPDITAKDDPALTKQFETKARYATITTSRVFELLKKAGLPVAYLEQGSDTEFAALDCLSINVEVIARRWVPPGSSYAKRCPEFARPEGELPHRFDEPLIEFFLKTTGGKLTGLSGKLIVEGLNREAGEEDPLIINPLNPYWWLYHSKKPTSDPEANLKRRIKRHEVVKGPLAIPRMKEITTKAWLVLEKSWAALGMYLMDFKIEFGITPDGRLVIIDVIDNDSWRLRTKDWKEVSKEVFRQGGDLDEIEANYGFVAELAGKLELVT